MCIILTSSQQPPYSSGLVGGLGLFLVPSPPICWEYNYHLCLTPTQLFRFQNRYYFMMNILCVKEDFVCFECGSVLTNDFELNNHIMKYHK